MKTRYNRRQFLAVAGAGGLRLVVLHHSQSAHGYYANEKLNLALIGAGGRGAQNLTEVASENILALCDVDERRAADSFAEFPSAEKCRDYRRMLGELDRRIDAVVVSTPNHVHAPASVMAMRMGKHCYW
ncbi:MAG: Gfo/Idh/MocA family protein [Pirellulaceae bacterium]